MRSMSIIFMFFVAFLSKTEALQCIDNGLTNEQRKSIVASKAVIDAKWKELIKSSTDVQKTNRCMRKYRDSRTYYSGKDIEVLNLLILYIEHLRICWYQNCVDKTK